MDPMLLAAREKLNQVTPLKKDCGRVCGARCCLSLEAEETGMLLFPGEKACYEGREGWTVRETSRGQIVFCPGRCDRQERPLACRLFPLLPKIRENGTVRTVMDLRAKAVCPLARQGLTAVDPAFAEAVREAGEMLARSGEQAGFLRMLWEEQEELRELRERMGGKTRAGTGEGGSGSVRQG